MTTHGGMHCPYDLSSIPEHEYVEAFVEFLQLRCIAKVESLLLAPEPEPHYSIDVAFLDLYQTNIQLSAVLLHQPLKLLPLFDQGLRQMQMKLMPEHDRQAEMCFKRNVHVRISRLTLCPALIRSLLPRTRDVGNFISVTGTVIRTGPVRMLESERQFACTKCKEVCVAKADPEQGNAIPKPSKCSNVECGATSFKPVPGSYPCRDYQEVKIQEQMEKVGVGGIPRSILVLLYDDLVDTAQAGDEITISGVVMRRWKPLWPDARCDLDMFLEANQLVLNNDTRMHTQYNDEQARGFRAFWDKMEHQRLRARNHILRAVCPQVYGMMAVKLGLALVMIGGVRHEDGSGMKVRGECHMLMVGDPGTGKSQFLKFAASVSTRSVLTTGIGTSSAGLTVTAVKEQGSKDWSLEAGALVLADGGLCAIDEFSSIRSGDRATIHEAMEQQTISVAKAGLVCKLNTRTTIVAATNPKGKYDPTKSMSVNVAIASPLLSRFDLILVLCDTHNKDWDTQVSQYILDGRPAAATAATRVSGPGNSREKLPAWDMDMLRAYLAFVKTECVPTISKDAQTVLLKYYQLHRTDADNNAGRTTIRLLESLVRLTQAHARLVFRPEAVVQDAVVAVWLMDMSLSTTGLTSNASAAARTGFADNPDEEYLAHEALVLQQLGLEHLRAPAHRQTLPRQPGTRSPSSPPPPPHQQHHSMMTANRLIDHTDPGTPPSSLPSPQLVAGLGTRAAALAQQRRPGIADTDSDISGGVGTVPGPRHGILSPAVDTVDHVPPSPTPPRALPRVANDPGSASSASASRVSATNDATACQGQSRADAANAVVSAPAAVAVVTESGPILAPRSDSDNDDDDGDEVIPPPPVELLSSLSPPSPSVMPRTSQHDVAASDSDGDSYMLEDGDRAPQRSFRGMDQLDMPPAKRTKVQASQALSYLAEDEDLDALDAELDDLM